MNLITKTLKNETSQIRPKLKEIEAKTLSLKIWISGPPNYFDKYYYFQYLKNEK